MSLKGLFVRLNKHRESNTRLENLHDDFTLYQSKESMLHANSAFVIKNVSGFSYIRAL